MLAKLTPLARDYSNRGSIFGFNRLGLICVDKSCLQWIECFVACMACSAITSTSSKSDTKKSLITALNNGWWIIFSPNGKILLIDVPVQLKVSYITEKFFFCENRDGLPSCFGPIHRTCDALEDRSTPIFARVEFCHPVDHDPSAKCSNCCAMTEELTQNFFDTLHHTSISKNIYWKNKKYLINNLLIPYRFLIWNLQAFFSYVYSSAGVGRLNKMTVNGHMKTKNNALLAITNKRTPLMSTCPYDVYFVLLEWKSMPLHTLNVSISIYRCINFQKRRLTVEMGGGNGLEIRVFRMAWLDNEIWADIVRFMLHFWLLNDLILLCKKYLKKKLFCVF